jgi:hypothetical protein
MSGFDSRSRDFEATAANDDQNSTQQDPNSNNAANNPFEALGRYVTNGSVMIPMEALEKLYLNPPSKVSGDLRRTFGNPTPM